jgi:ketosteroid isomerase-like protein
VNQTAFFPPKDALTDGGYRSSLKEQHTNGGLVAPTSHKLEVIDAGGDDKVVYGTANWSAEGKDKDGKPADFSGIATHVFERQPDNSLKLRLHTLGPVGMSPAAAFAFEVEPAASVAREIS